MNQINQTSDTLRRIEKTVREVTGRNEIHLEPQTRLSSEAGVGSFLLISIVCALEEEFDIHIENTAVFRFTDVQSVIDYIEETTTNAQTTY